ncbi:MAG: glucokinase [Pseudomonadota bacterium]
MIKPQTRRAGDIAPVPYPALVADIGGTNVRFAVLMDAHSTPREFATIQTGKYESLSEAATVNVLDTTSVMPRSLLLALAGPVHAGPSKLTNADWVIDPETLLQDLNLETVITFNDFEALSLSLPALRYDQMMQVGGGAPQSRHPRVVLGPGTGLGVAALMFGDQRFRPVAGEGGHISFGPETARDFAIWPHIEKTEDRVTGETILSGDGLARIYRAVASAEGKDGSDCRKGEEVTSRADAGDPLAHEAIGLFLTYLGRLAGDLALLFLPKGGVYVAGGIAPRLTERFAASGFRAAFEAKHPHTAMLKEIPTFVVTEPRPALAGLAAFAIMPERFAVDLAGRRFEG